MGAFSNSASSYEMNDDMKACGPFGSVCLGIFVLPVPPRRIHGCPPQPTSRTCRPCRGACPLFHRDCHAQSAEDDHFERLPAGAADAVATRAKEPDCSWDRGHLTNRSSSPKCASTVRSRPWSFEGWASASYGRGKLVTRGSAEPHDVGRLDYLGLSSPVEIERSRPQFSLESWITSCFCFARLGCFPLPPGC